MPRRKIEAPPPPTETELEDDAGEDADPTPLPKKKRKARAPAGQAQVTPFGSMPAGTTHWRLQRVHPNGEEEQLEGPSARGGMHVRRWPIEELSAERILAIWGPGTYRVRFMGPTPKGTCAFKGWGEYVTIQDPAGAASPQVPAPSSSPASPFGGGAFEQSIALYGFISQQAAAQTQQTIAMATAMMTAARPAAPTGPDPRDQILQQQQRQINELLGELRARGGDDDDDDDDDDEDDDDEGGPFRPGESAIDTAKAAALNKLWEQAPEIVGLLINTFAKQPAPTPALANGAPPAPTPAASGSTMESGSVTTKA